MRGIILAGGSGSRLGLLTRNFNKHMLPVDQMPMILWPLKTLTDMGITDVMITVGGNSVGEIMNLIKDGSEFGCNVTYKYQKGANGIADAIRITEDFIGDDNMIVVLGDNIFFDYKDHMSNFVEAFGDYYQCGAACILKEVNDPERFGVAEVQDGRIISIEEKPKQPKSNYAITGLYYLHNNVFKVIKNLQPSARGEYEITDVLRHYMLNGQLFYSVFDSPWTDAGTYDSLLRANILAKEYTES